MTNRKYRIISVCQFKLPNYGVIYYTAIDNTKNKYHLLEIQKTIIVVGSVLCHPDAPPLQG